MTHIHVGSPACGQARHVLGGRAGSWCRARACTFSHMAGCTMAPNCRLDGDVALMNRRQPSSSRMPITRVGEGRAVQGTDAQADSCSGTTFPLGLGFRRVNWDFSLRPKGAPKSLPSRPSGLPSP